MNRGAAVALRQETPHLDEATDVIRRVSNGHWRSFPKFPLRKGQRVESGFAALNPFFETGALLRRHLGSSGWRSTLSAAHRFGRVGVALAAEQAVDLLIGKRFKIHLTNCFVNCFRRRRRWRGLSHRRGAAHLARNQRRNLSDGSRSHQARRW